MKIEQLYAEIKDLADKLGILVSEHNFNITGIHVKSGLCKIRNQNFLIIDKHKSVVEKLQILSSVIAARNLENIYVVPAVRQHLESVRPKTSSGKH